jgi:hypothetical protein
LISKNANTQAKLVAAESNPQILTLTDWSNHPAEDLTALYLASGADPLYVSSLIIDPMELIMFPDASIHMSSMEEVNKSARTLAIYNPWLSLTSYL